MNEIYYIYAIAAVIIILSMLAIFYFIYKKNLKENLPFIFRDYAFPLISPIFKNIFIWSDPDGKILLANNTASEVLKISPQEFIRSSLDKVLPASDIKKLRISLPGQILNFQTELIVKDGEKIITEITAIKVKILDREWGYLISADSHMQELIALENKLEIQKGLAERYLKQLEKLEDILKDIFNKPQKSRLEILSEITMSLHDFFGAYLTICWKNETEENFRLIAQKGAIKSSDETIRNQLLPGNEITQVISSKKTVIAEISALDEPLKTFLASEGVFAVVLVPYFDQKNKIEGIFGFYLQNKIGFEENKKLFNMLSVLMTILYILLDIKISSSEEAEKIKTEHNEKVGSLSEKLQICEEELKDLQKFQQVAIGRELEMIELKNRIKQLEDAKHG